MPEPVTSEIPESVTFDPSDREAWRVRLRQLTLRALATFTTRCAKRLEPLVRLGQLKVDAYSVGIDIDASLKHGWKAVANAASAATVSVATTYNAVSNNAALAAAAAYSAIAGNTAAADTDLQKLLDLNLGKPGEPGEPIRWNDPRLGPLWPDGEPEWYTAAERACRELEDELRNLPEPSAGPSDPVLEAQFEEWRKLDVLYNEGKLNKYRGEYVIWADGEIFAHGRHLLNVRLQAEELAGAKGITPNQLIDYFVPGE
jgi:hypothetical protein